MLEELKHQRKAESGFHDEELHTYLKVEVRKGVVVANVFERH